MRYFLDISFRGAQYHGWQIQPHDVSVQETLEKAFAAVLRTPVPLTGAGRTDAGVNARRMVAHADIPIGSTDSDSLRKAVNAICRPDIVVNSMTPVADSAHARFDAVRRTYRYFVHTQPDPFAYPLSWQAPAGLDFQAMNRAARTLVGTHDFTSFAKLHSDAKTNICTVTEAQWHPMPDETGRWYFQISADRFLRNMVRAVVGTLVLIGKGKTDADGLKDIMDSYDRCAAGTSMPAHALFLWDVNYPYYNTLENQK
ncbi:MAG: tRNA pseudouridine(38-40) synthase TruA [Bacteroidales bacterium]|nr:tRNA pseudouridine(38-40) synthase TruA [Bacteroidales bacterium]